MGKINMWKAMLNGDPYVASIRETPPDTADLIVAQLPIHSLKVIELGGGTGAITRKLLHALFSANGRKAELRILERNELLFRELQERFPDLREMIHHKDAAGIEDMFKEETRDAIVSGIPYSWYSKKTREKMIRGAMSLLRPGGRLIVYQISDKVVESMQEVFRSDVRIIDVPEAKSFDPQFVFVAEKGSDKLDDMKAPLYGKQNGAL